MTVSNRSCESNSRPEEEESCIKRHFRLAMTVASSLSRVIPLLDVGNHSTDFITTRGGWPQDSPVVASTSTFFVPAVVRLAPVWCEHGSHEQNEDSYRREGKAWNKRRQLVQPAMAYSLIVING
jgi:hypothetical protein